MTAHAAASHAEHIQSQEEPDFRDIVSILVKHNEDRGGLIAVLGEIQAKYGFLPQEVLRTVSEWTGRSLVDIYGVATFYRSFSFAPRGKHLIVACLGTACHVRGAPRVVEELQRQLGIKPGDTTPDKEFTLETVNCLGACALGPIVVVDGCYFSNVNITKVKGILKKVRIGLPQVEESAAGTSNG